MSGLGDVGPVRRPTIPITVRILSVNVLALVVLVVGTLSVADFREGLIQQQTDILLIQANVIADTLSDDMDQGAVATSDEMANGVLAPGALVLPAASVRTLRVMAEQTKSRARVFDRDGNLVADSRVWTGPGPLVQARELSPPRSTTERLGRAVNGILDWLVAVAWNYPARPPYLDRAQAAAEDYEEVMVALTGHEATAVRRVVLPPESQSLVDVDRLEQSSRTVICVAAPIQRTSVLGAVYLTKNSDEIDQAAWNARLAILQTFLVTLVLTVFLSLYLSRTIATPLRRLAHAADVLRRDRTLQHPLPDFSSKRNEIGQLSIALDDLTDALRWRFDAIERFAADVSHEIKNPLASLRSALDTLKRVEKPEQRDRLLAIVESDVSRIDRLIRDISDVSRLDAELSRIQGERIDVAELLTTLIEIMGPAADDVPVRLRLTMDDRRELIVHGLKERLLQVFSNLVVNALSFSPPDSRIDIMAWRNGDDIEVVVDDQGPGIPPGFESKIFDRFYSHRRKGETFGQHSGLGLSISKQIVDAHFGSIHGENRVRKSDRRPESNTPIVEGARFVVRLPAV